MTDPRRPGVDDNPDLEALIASWRDGEADIDSRLSQALRAVFVAAVASDARRRLRAQARRLEALRAAAIHTIDELVIETREAIEAGLLSDIYEAGARRVRPFSFSPPHQAAVRALNEDAYDAVLRATAHIDADSKAWVRRVSKELASLQITEGVPVKRQGRRFAQKLAKEFTARGMAGVTYRNGAVHGFGSYGEMLLRTQTALAYNTGTLNQARQARIQFFEILDGTDCGLVSHHDPQLANGMIVPFEIAAAYPLSHPNCRRALNARPDVTVPSLLDGEVRSVQPPEKLAAQIAFERAAAAQSGRRRRGRTQRQARTRRRART